MSIIKKKYPSADLRKYYFITLEIGFILTLILLNLLFRIDFSVESQLELVKVEQEVIVMDDVVRTEHINRPPPPPRPQAPRSVPDDVIIDDPFFDLSTDLDLDGMHLSLPEPPLPPPRFEEEEDYEPEVFTIVEDMPVLVGGMNAIYENLHYPEVARMAGIEGRVIIQFVIDEQGNVVDPVVVRGVGGGLDEAALAAVKNISFIPGRQRGHPVRVRYSLPITFRLSN